MKKKKISKLKLHENKTVEQLSDTEIDDVIESLNEEYVTDEEYLVQCIELLRGLTKEELLDLYTNRYIDNIHWLKSYINEEKINPDRTVTWEYDNFDIFDFIKPKFKKDKELIIELIIKMFLGKFESVDNRLKKDKKFIGDLLSNESCDFPYFFEFVDQSFKEDIETAKYFLSKNHKCFFLLDDKLKENKEIKEVHEKYKLEQIG